MKFLVVVEVDVDNTSGNLADVVTLVTKGLRAVEVEPSLNGETYFTSRVNCIRKV